MKKPKLIFKINRNNTAKIYVGGKWQKLFAIPSENEISLHRRAIYDTEIAEVSIL